MWTKLFAEEKLSSSSMMSAASSATKDGEFINKRELRARVSEYTVVGSPAPQTSPGSPWQSPPDRGKAKGRTQLGRTEPSLSLGLLQSWRIIDAVSSHCDDITKALLAKGLVGLDTRF